MKKEIRNIVIGIVFLVLLLSIGVGVRVAENNNPAKEPCLKLLDEAMNKCDWTIKVGAWSWSCNDEEVYTKMMNRNDTGLFCVEKYFADFDAFLTYTCEMKDRKLVEETIFRVDDKLCADFIRTHFNG